MAKRNFQWSLPKPPAIWSIDTSHGRRTNPFSCWWHISAPTSYFEGWHFSWTLNIRRYSSEAHNSCYCAVPTCCFLHSGFTQIEVMWQLSFIWPGISVEAFYIWPSSWLFIVKQQAYTTFTVAQTLYFSTRVGIVRVAGGRISFCGVLFHLFCQSRVELEVHGVSLSTLGYRDRTEMHVLNSDSYQKYIRT